MTCQPFVLLDDMHCLGRQTLQLCADRNCAPAVSCHTAQLLTVQELVALGQGVSLVPEMATGHNRDNRVVYRPLDGAPVEARNWHDLAATLSAATTRRSRARSTAGARRASGEWHRLPGVRRIA